MFEPVIKWSGSKRSQASKILTYFPKEIHTYYEPFCGGASVLNRLLHSDIKVNNYVCSDLNQGLIDLWNEIMYHPEQVIMHYATLWHELNIDEDKQRKKEYFTKVRDRYNQEHNPLDFMFIMRTTTNGMPRYNNKGEFNSSFHFTRDGMHPHTLANIVNDWSDMLKSHNVKFISCSYEDIKPSPDDFVYMDPPYAHTKGMYYGAIDYPSMWDWVRSLPCKYILSFDGISGDDDNTYTVPEDIYSTHEYIFSGNSSFKRIVGKSKNCPVYESLYIKD